MSDQAFTTVTTMHAVAGREDDLAAALAEITPPSLAEEGCGRYQVGRRLDDPAQFLIVAAFDSPEALTVHQQSPHAAVFGERTEGVFVEPFTTITVKQFEL
jgi:quinol monooxygenase YgiN